MAEADTAVEVEFRELCARLQASANKFYGKRPARRFGAWLGSEDSRRADPAIREVRRLMFGREFLELGRTEEAVRVLEEMKPEPPVEAATSSTRPSTGSAGSRSGGVDESDVALPDAADPADLASLSAEGRGDSSDPSLRVRHLALLRNAHLRAGEERNCVLNHSAASCILPFHEKRLHALPEHAPRAGDLSLAILQLRPSSV